MADRGDAVVRSGAVVLAAGAGTRFAGPGHKLAVPLATDATVAGRAVGVALEAAIGPVAVVVGAAPARSLSLPEGVTIVVNEQWEDGQATSLAAAVAWARAEGLTELVVGLGDQPGLVPDAWRAVAAARRTPMSVARYGERRGHPVRFAAEVWDLFPTDGDAGARDLLRSRSDLVTEVACPGDPFDIDTVEDLAAWTHRDG